MALQKTVIKVLDKVPAAGDIPAYPSGSKSVAVLGLSTGFEVTSPTHIVAFDLLYRDGKAITVGKNNGTVSIREDGNYHLTVSGWANSEYEVTVLFHYPETSSKMLTLASTTVPSIKGICLFNGISTTLSLRAGETLQLRLLSSAAFQVAEGLRWEITQC
jgi:hypothetical protein